MNISSMSQVMQISDIKKSNTNAYNSVTKDYSSYSISDLRDIPYGEAKENIDLIKARAQEIRSDENYKEKDAGESFALTTQLNNITFTNNENTNESLYNTYQSFESTLDAVMFHTELNDNLRNYYGGNEINASFVKTNDNQNNADLNQFQLNSINFESFLNTMLDNFTKKLEQSPSSIKNQYSTIVDGYLSLKDNYESNINRSFYG